MTHFKSRALWPGMMIAAFIIGLLLIAGLSATQARRDPDPPVPLPGLTTEQLARFQSPPLTISPAFPCTLGNMAGGTLEVGTCRVVARHDGER